MVLGRMPELPVWECDMTIGRNTEMWYPMRSVSDSLFVTLDGLHLKASVRHLSRTHSGLLYARSPTIVVYVLQIILNRNITHAWSSPLLLSSILPFPLLATHVTMSIRRTATTLRHGSHDEQITVDHRSADTLSYVATNPLLASAAIRVGSDALRRNDPVYVGRTIHQMRHING